MLFILTWVSVLFGLFFIDFGKVLVIFVGFASSLVAELEFIVELLQLFDNALYYDQIVEGNVYLSQVQIEFGLLEIQKVVICHQLLVKGGVGDLLDIFFDLQRILLRHLVLSYDLGNATLLAFDDLQIAISQIEWVNHLTLVKVLDW